jgi:hypothetical protein
MPLIFCSTRQPISFLVCTLFLNASPSPDCAAWTADYETDDRKTGHHDYVLTCVPVYNQAMFNPRMAWPRLTLYILTRIPTCVLGLIMLVWICPKTVSWLVFLISQSSARQINFARLKLLHFHSSTYVSCAFGLPTPWWCRNWHIMMHNTCYRDLRPKPVYLCKMWAMHCAVIVNPSSWSLLEYWAKTLHSSINIELE